MHSALSPRRGTGLHDVCRAHDAHARSRRGAALARLRELVPEFVVTPGPRRSAAAAPATPRVLTRAHAACEAPRTVRSLRARTDGPRDDIVAGVRPPSPPRPSPPSRRSWSSTITPRCSPGPAGGSSLAYACWRTSAPGCASGRATRASRPPRATRVAFLTTTRGRSPDWLERLLSAYDDAPCSRWGASLGRSGRTGDRTTCPPELGSAAVGCTYLGQPTSAPTSGTCGAATCPCGPRFLSTGSAGSDEVVGRVGSVPAGQRGDRALHPDRQRTARRVGWSSSPPPWCTTGSPRLRTEFPVSWSRAPHGRGISKAAMARLVGARRRDVRRDPPTPPGS